MLILKPVHMPGPSEEARALQYEQYVARDAMYEAWNQALSNCGYDYEVAARDATLARCKAAYEQTVKALEALLGEDAHCDQVDCDLWSLFSDCYKDDAGFRPRFYRSRREVQYYFEQRVQSAHTEEG